MLNYKQLYYFWNVAKAGSITRAAERLHLTPRPSVASSASSNARWAATCSGVSDGGSN